MALTPCLALSFCQGVKVRYYFCKHILSMQNPKANVKAALLIYGIDQKFMPSLASLF